jgi:hypothetical protein
LLNLQARERSESGKSDEARDRSQPVSSTLNQRRSDVDSISWCSDVCMMVVSRCPNELLAAPAGPAAAQFVLSAPAFLAAGLVSTLPRSRPRDAKPHHSRCPPACT